MMKWIYNLTLLALLMPCAAISADYSGQLQNKRLVMKGANRAGIEFKGKNNLIGYAELTGDIPIVEALVKWIRNDLFLVVEKGRVSENCPPRTWLYEIISSSEKTIKLKEYWTGWPESKDEIIEYNINGSALANPTFEYKFQDFPAKEKYKGTPAKPKIKTQSDRLFRTRLREAAAEQPDFAGHFKVATWGCGSDGCTSFRIIDSNNGEILPVGGTVSRSCRQGYDEDILVYQPNSRLFIINGNLDDERLGVFYYEFKNKKLILLKEAPHPRKDVNCFQPES